jgi:hypothetical protein
MSLELLLCVFLALGWLTERLFHAWAEAGWRKERGELISRVQAGTLRDYTNHTPHPTSAKENHRGDPTSVVSVSSWAEPETVDTVGARAAYERLQSATESEE